MRAKKKGLPILRIAGRPVRCRAGLKSSAGLLMKPGAEPFYPIASLWAINWARLVRRRDQSLQWRFTILPHLIETEMN